MPSYYQLLADDAPWGDYGNILWNGIVEKLEDKQPPILATRTGPFVPPITQPFGHILVTDEFREKLQKERFSGLSFQPARYGKVVKIPWEKWKESNEPASYPDSGEPEDYLLSGAHDEITASEMPALWAWDVAPTVGLQVQGSSTFRRDLHPGTDVAREFLVFWISERMQSWLALHAGKWLRFAPVTPK